jgi:hypothetical protein
VNKNLSFHFLYCVLLYALGATNTAPEDRFLVRQPENNVDVLFRINWHAVK